MGKLLLALDVGNTNTVVGLFEDADLRRKWRLTTQSERTADEVGLWLHQLMEWEGVALNELHAVAISSVVPPLDARLRDGVLRYLDCNPFFIVPGIKTGMPLRVEAPQELGADRICDSVAAFARYGGPCVVIDFGTATTWEIVSEKGEYLGGVIAPGPSVTADALWTRAAKLPRVPMAPPERVIGKATVDSIQSGLFHGYLGLVDGITRRVLSEVGKATIVATGGFAPVIAEHSELIEHVDGDLTLDGLRLLWEKNSRGNTA